MECNKFVDRCIGCLSLNVCVDEDLEGYDKMVTGKRKTQRVSLTLRLICFLNLIKFYFIFLYSFIHFI